MAGPDQAALHGVARGPQSVQAAGDLRRDRHRVELDQDPRGANLQRPARAAQLGPIPTPPSAIQSNMVSEPDRVGEAIKALFEAKGIRARKAVTAVPGTRGHDQAGDAAAQSAQETENTIMFEAGNFIPEELDNVNLDYQVIDYAEDAQRDGGPAGRGQEGHRQQLRRNAARRRARSRWSSTSTTSRSITCSSSTTTRSPIRSWRWSTSGRATPRSTS